MVAAHAYDLEAAAILSVHLYLEHCSFVCITNRVYRGRKVIYIHRETEYLQVNLDEDRRQLGN
jgi:putative heme iron utilization protein